MHESIASRPRRWASKGTLLAAGAVTAVIAAVGLSAGPALAAATNPPTGTATITSVTEDATSPVVTVQWDGSGVTWDSQAVDKQWVVSVSPASVAAGGTCSGTIAYTATSCQFTATANTTYTVTVSPTNDHWGGTPSSPGTVTVAHVQPMTGTATMTASALDPATGKVTVHWSMPSGTWGTGANPRWTVTMDDAQLNPGSSPDCYQWNLADTSDNHCSFEPWVNGTYTVRVKPSTDNDQGAEVKLDVPITTIPPLAAPTNVSGTPGENSITVSWTAPSGGPVNAYDVYATTPAFPDDYKFYCMEETVDAGPCHILQLPAGLTYTVHVTAYGRGGASPEVTAVVSGSPTGAPPSPEEVPAEAVSVGHDDSTPGAQVTISGSGYLPGTLVRIAVYSTPIDLGTAVVQPDGTFSATVTLPASLPVGSHTLLASGLDSDGMERYVSKALTVSAPVPAVSAPVAAKAGGNTLPITGGNVTWLVVTAFALLVLGAAAIAVTDGRVVRRLHRRAGVTG